MAFQQLLPWLVRIGPASFRRKVVETAPHGTVTQRMKHISDIMYIRSTEIVNEKKAALAKGDEALKERGKDLMSVLREWYLPSEELANWLLCTHHSCHLSASKSDGGR